MNKYNLIREIIAKRERDVCTVTNTNLPVLEINIEGR